jgi:hypothetical protein
MEQKPYSAFYYYRITTETAWSCIGQRSRGFGHLELLAISLYTHLHTLSC